jgi:hypothetical protein
LRKVNLLRYMLLIIPLLLLALSDTGHGQPNDMPDPDSSFKDLQRQLNTQLVEYTQQQVDILNSMKDYIGKEQYDSAWDYLPETPQFQQQIRRNRGDDEFNYSRVRLDSLKLKTMAAESRKNELKMKVLDYNKQLPEWWEKAEAEFRDRRRQVVQSGLRR